MRITMYFLILVMMTGCTYSLREDIIRNQRPDSLKVYKGGVISPLGQKDIEEAIQFGKTNEHNQSVINYAFTFAKDTSNLLTAPSRTEYVLVCTNYYLIADYAAKQTRNYEKIDMDYVNFLANLITFKIEAMEAMGDVFYPVQVGSKFVLLKNGIKVEESKEMPLYKSSNPYAASHLATSQSSMNDIMEKSIEVANKMAESYQKDMKVNLNSVPNVTNEHLYAYKDIDLTSKYEVVIIYSDREVHVPVDFLNIK